MTETTNILEGQRQLPPSDRTEVESDRELVARLKSFIANNSLSQSSVAKKTGVDRLPRSTPG